MGYLGASYIVNDGKMMTAEAWSNIPYNGAIP